MYTSARPTGGESDRGDSNDTNHSMTKNSNNFTVKTSNSLLPSYLDKSLADRPGEIWVPLLDLEEYISISNFGRIKRNPRRVTYKNGRSKYVTAAILATPVIQSKNKTIGDFTFQLLGSIMIEGKTKRFSIRRMVYYHFVEEFDIDDDMVVILPLNGNGLEIVPNNLKKATILTKVRRSVSTGRMRNEFKHVDYNKAIKASAACTSKTVSQYNEQGERINTFQSIHEAARICGVAFNHISDVCNFRQQTAQGYYWRHGCEEKLDIAFIRARKSESIRLKRGTKVTQFDLRGVPIAYFNNLQDAAKSVGCSYTAISAAIRGINKTGGGYIWRKGHIQEKLFESEKSRLY